MKTTALVTALSLAAAFAFSGAAHAQEATYELPQPAVSSKTRAQVQAEVHQARAAGTLQPTEAGWPQVAFVPQKTRAEVKAETLAAIASGEVRLLNAEPQSAVLVLGAAPAQSATMTVAASR
jgi:Domain of unknown function (DUF4148)